MGVWFTGEKIGDPAQILNRFNRNYPLIERADLLKFPKSRTTDGRQIGKIYYGVNISPYKEPIEQFDPLLLIRLYNNLLQDYTGLRTGKADAVFLSVFIAGKYRALNLRPAQNPYSAYAQWELQENNKRELYLQVAKNLGILEYTQVLTTDDLWKDERYWALVVNFTKNKELAPNKRAFNSVSVKFGDIPQKMLGGITQNQREALANEDACNLYLYAELAEAVYLKNYYEADAKIGPATEEEYDKYLRSELSIIQLKNPLDISSTPANEISCCPYIGTKGQLRFWVSDAKRQENDLRNYVRTIIENSTDYERGPIEQWALRILIYGEQIMASGGYLTNLADSITNYIKNVMPGGDQT